MEEALALRRGPRTYLAPSPPRKYVPPETYKPQIDEHSKQLAAKKRPKVGRVGSQFRQAARTTAANFSSFFF